MFRFDEGWTYRMPAHFLGGPGDGMADTLYDDVTSVAIAYTTDEEQLSQYVPDAFEILEPVISVNYQRCPHVQWMGGAGYNLIAVATPARHLSSGVAGAFILVILLLVDILYAPPDWQIKLEDYQRRRLLVYFGQDYVRPGANPDVIKREKNRQRNDSYNVRQALISVGSGGLTGKGWRQGDQIRLGFLPRGVAHNDFIFSVIAEERGFLGSVTVLALYTVVLFSGLRTAGQARDRLGRLLAVGVVTLLFSHIFINIGMNIRIMPVTGIPLPLLSYGGSSVLCSLIAAGILHNVYRFRKSY